MVPLTTCRSWLGPIVPVVLSAIALFGSAASATEERSTAKASVLVNDLLVQFAETGLGAGKVVPFRLRADVSTTFECRAGANVMPGQSVRVIGATTEAKLKSDPRG